MKIICEEKFQTIMEKEITPFLEQCREDWLFERCEGELVHCVGYYAEKPKGIIAISHGFTESAQKYKEVIYYFLKQQYHVYVMEHCGHGYSYRLTEDISKVHIDHYERYVDDFIEFVLRSKKSHDLPVYLYAHSMGCAIGLLAAAKEPLLFEKLVMSSPMIKPVTKSMPWTAVHMITRLMALCGKGEDYIAGHTPYNGKELFEYSCSVSEERFNYYNDEKAVVDKYQTSGASYQWLCETTRMFYALMFKVWWQIKCPVLFFQAEFDQVVSSKAQIIFYHLMKIVNKNTQFCIVNDAKHEIYNSHDDVLNKYWRKIMRFLNI